MILKATWYEFTETPSIVVLDIDRFAMPAAVAEMIEKIRIAKSSPGHEILPENIVYMALTDFAEKNFELVLLGDERIMAEAEAKAEVERKRLENAKVEQVFCGMAK